MGFLVLLLLSSFVRNHFLRYEERSEVSYIYRLQELDTAGNYDGENTFGIFQ